jgi:hypothetical protein
MTTPNLRTANIRIKRGETFLLECQVLESDGTALDIADWGIASQVRDGYDVLIADLEVDIYAPEAGKYRLLCDDTKDWPPGLNRMDIAYTDVGDRMLSTETLAVTVVHEVTQR